MKHKLTFNLNENLELDKGRVGTYSSRYSIHNSEMILFSLVLGAQRIHPGIKSAKDSSRQMLHGSYQHTFYWSKLSRRRRPRQKSDSNPEY